MACYSRSTLPWPLPSTSHPLTSLHTWESEQQRLMEKKPSEDPARPACPAAPHSLNELQPLLDVRLPSLPLHQSLGERAVYPLVSSGRGLVTIPTPLWALSFPHSSHFAGAPIGHGPFHSLQTPCEPSHAAPALHAHAPLDCFVRCLCLCWAGAAWSPPAFPHTRGLGGNSASDYPKVKEKTLLYQQTQSKEKRYTRYKMMPMIRATM